MTPGINARPNARHARRIAFSVHNADAGPECCHLRKLGQSRSARDSAVAPPWLVLRLYVAQRRARATKDLCRSEQLVSSACLQDDVMNAVNGRRDAEFGMRRRYRGFPLELARRIVGVPGKQ